MTKVCPADDRKRDEAFSEQGERYPSPFSSMRSPRLGEYPLLHLTAGIICKEDPIAALPQILKQSTRLEFRDRLLMPSFGIGICTVWEFWIISLVFGNWRKRSLSPKQKRGGEGGIRTPSNWA